MEIKDGLKDSCKIWVVSGSYELTGKVFEYVVKFLFAYDRSFSKYLTGGQGGRPYVLKLSESIWIQCKSSSEPNSLLGERVDLEIVDEAALVADNVYYQNIRPSVSVLGGRTYFISTPRGKSWFKDKFYFLKDRHAAFTFASSDGKHYTKEILNELQKTTPDLLFRQEYLAEFVDNAGRVFRDIDSILEECASDSIPGHHYVMGVDLAQSEDWTAISIFDAETKKEVHLDRFQKRDYTLQKRQIFAKAMRYNNARIIMDTTGVGRPIYDDLRQEGLFVEDFTFTGKSKEELIGKMIVSVEEKYIRLQPVQYATDEMEAFEFQYRDEKTGLPLKNIKYSAPQGYHDDTVCARSLANWGLANYSIKKPDLLKQMLSRGSSNPGIQSFI